jgi:hypothetical protein
VTKIYYVKLSQLHLLSFAPRIVSRRVEVRPVLKIIAESISQHAEKHLEPSLLSGIKVGKL